LTLQKGEKKRLQRKGKRPEFRERERSSFKIRYLTLRNNKMRIKVPRLNKVGKSHAERVGAGGIGD